MKARIAEVAIAERDGEGGVAVDGEAAEQVHDDPGHLGGEPDVVRVQARRDQIARDQQRRDECAGAEEDQRRRELHREPRRHCAGFGEEHERAQAADAAARLLGLLLLALDPDQGAEKERDREVAERQIELQQVHVGGSLSPARRNRQPPRPAGCRGGR